MSHPIRCQCGALQGRLDHPERGLRLACYCKDCQAYARFLGRSGDILDALGGTDVVAVHPQQLTFTAGQEQLACMSLSAQGLLRWYARCCNTPIGATSRKREVAHIGLVHNCLSAAAPLDAVFGPVRMRAATGNARQAPPPVAGGGALATLPRFAWRLLRARLDGSYRRSPLFAGPDAAPVAPVHTLSPAERAVLEQP